MRSNDVDRVGADPFGDWCKIPESNDDWEKIDEDDTQWQTPTS